jgi:hypothetical protein
LVPYGVYDVTAYARFSASNITSDPGDFAVQLIRCWGERMGRQRYPKGQEMMITGTAEARTTRACGCAKRQPDFYVLLSFPI